LGHRGGRRWAGDNGKIKTQQTETNCAKSGELDHSELAPKSERQASDAGASTVS
jgi:hypothetical protein